MKSRNICPKCNSTDVVKVPPFKGTSTSNTVQLTKWGTQAAYFERYICVTCGYMEHYILTDDPAFQKWLEKHIEENSLDSDFV
jgi:predicted nucleic-acid-binding Zn-ribbon protein